LQIGKAMLSTKSNDGGIITPNFNLNYKDIIIKISMLLAQKQM
jgi:hypothetical protein